MEQVANKVAVVFGGNGGIGKCTVLELINNKTKGVIVADLHGSQEGLSGISKENNMFYIKFDVTKLNDVKAVFNFALEKFNSIDIVVNCVGVINEDSVTNLSVNLIGAIHIITEAYDYLATYKSSTTKQASIINLASIAGLTPLIHFPLYSAGKAGGITYAYSLAKHKEITCNGGELSVKLVTMCPHATDTSLLDHGQAMLETTGAQVQKELVELFKAQSRQRPESVAQCILDVIENGANASVWLSRNDKQAKLIDYEALIGVSMKLIEN